MPFTNARIITIMTTMNTILCLLTRPLSCSSSSLSSSSSSLRNCKSAASFSCCSFQPPPPPYPAVASSRANTLYLYPPTNQLSLLHPLRRHHGSKNHHLKQGASFRLYSTNNNSPLSSSSLSLSSSSSAIIHRSQGKTHLDQVEDAVHASLLHYRPQLKLQNNNNNIDQPSSESSSSSSLETTIILNNPENILSFPPSDRECISVASNLQRRFEAFARSGDCRRCWLQRRHCVCGHCASLEENQDGIPNVNRLFLLTHHKEICLAVDTAKLILAAFPSTAQLVVSGIGRQFQPAMGEMLDAVSNARLNHENGYLSKCLILFPTDDAKTFQELKNEIVMMADNNTNTVNINNDDTTIDKGWDVIVIDGTWVQARKMHAKYFSQFDNGGSLYRVQLSPEAVQLLGGDDNDDSTTQDNDNGGDDDGRDDGVVEEGVAVKGRQLRRHPIKWREISTLEATRLLLNDMHQGQSVLFEEQSSAMAQYQEIGNDAAKRQLGPPRVVV